MPDSKFSTGVQLSSHILALTAGVIYFFGFAEVSLAESFAIGVIKTDEAPFILPVSPFSINSLRCFAHASATNCWPRAASVPNSRLPWLLL